MKIIDLTFGLNNQAWAIAHYLYRFDFDLEDSLWWVQTFPWYNGRERGIGIQLRHMANQKRRR